MLSHLIYVSTRKPNCTSQEIDKILESCKKNNADIDITGVLLYSDTKFIQYLEGDYKLIMSLYDKIKTDDRHKNVALINSTPIKERSFPSWQMGAKKINESEVKFNTDLSDQEKRHFQEILEGKTSEGGNSIHLLKKFFK